MTSTPGPTSERNTRIVLASRPDGEPSTTDFRVEHSSVPSPDDGQLLLRTIYLSLDPYMRGRMSAAKSYAASIPVDEVMVGGTVCEVVESRHRDYAAGELVLAHSGWQTYAVSGGDGLRRLDPSRAPVSTALGVLGMPGFTAYAGLLRIGRPRPRETVVVAAASGPVGSAVAQIARIHGARTVGIAGGPDKTAYVRDELGVDAVVDHRRADLPGALSAATPDGVDVYFENVGGPVWDAVMPLLNEFARVPVCGLVAHYNDTGHPDGPDRAPALMRTVLTKSLTLRGFIQREFSDEVHADFLRDVGGWVREGTVRYREDVVDGLENAPEAFIGMLRGRNFGKLLVQASPDPTVSPELSRRG